MNICNKILESVVAQDKAVALEALHKGWDDNITVDTIIQGLHARYKACNKEDVTMDGLRLIREDLKSVYIENKSGVSLIEIKQIPDSFDIRCIYRDSKYVVFDTIAVKAKHKELFHVEELKDIAAFLLENFHH